MIKSKWHYIVPYTILGLSVACIELIAFKNYLPIFAFINPLILGFMWYLHRTMRTHYLPAKNSNTHEIDRLLTQIDHEVNTPITTLSACLEYLGEENPQLEHLQTIRTNLQRLKDINSYYLKLLCIKNYTDLEATPFDLAEELRICMIECMHLLEHRNMQYVVKIPEKPVPVFGHSKLIRDALRHLMVHAVTNPEVRTQFHIHLSLHHNYAAITFEHHGQAPNLKRDHLAQQVFSLNTWASPQSMNQPLGTLGLSLALSRAIVEHHKGLIDYQYIGPKATRYYITLPIMS